MKRFLLCLVVVTTLFASYANAQVQFGIKAGANFGGVKFERHSNKYILKYHFGALARIPMNERFCFQPEVLYSQKGYELEVNYVPWDNELVFSYLSVPLLFAYNVKDFSFFVGPELDFKLAVYADREKWEDDPFETFDLGGVVGASYNFNSQIGIDVRYVYGFMDIINVDVRDENNTPLGTFADGQHRLFQLSVFYFFNAKKD